MNWLTTARWSPYAVGVGIGILSWFTFLLSDKSIGCSTAFARTGGMIEKVFRGSKVNGKLYYRKFPPIVDWEWMLVLGVVVGSLISSLMSGSFHFQWIPALWLAAFGGNTVLRVLVALGGGILMGFGARWAGGCTSGHGISGTLQLAVSSWITVIFFFIGGIVVARLIFNLIAG